MNEILDFELCNKLRETINRTDIFIKDSEEKKIFKLICAFMDRFDTAVKYINEHTDKPTNESELMLFMNYACIIKDGIKYICERLKINQDNDKKIFESIYRNSPLNIPVNINFSDDKFFEYMRAVIFAHPFFTSRAIPNPIENEIQYSPYTITDYWLGTDITSPVGAMIYSNKRDEIYAVIMSFEDLKKYVQDKYLKLNDIILRFENIINTKESQWKNRKVNRNQNDIDVLKECVDILKERYMEFNNVEALITNLECESSLQENEENVKKYRNEIRKIIPNICDALDNYNADDVYSVISSILYVRPQAHAGMHYQLEKIFCYLNDDYGDVEWGIIQAEAFAKEFAKKWVVIKPREMGFDEIKMLTNAACYLEYMKQNEGKYE